MSDFNLTFMDKFQRSVAWSQAQAAASAVGLETQHHDVLRLQQTVMELATTVGTLAKLLGNAGVIQLATLESEVNAAIAQQRALAANHGPSVTCPVCHRVVPASLTVITPEGPVCDVCNAVAPSP